MSCNPARHKRVKLVEGVGLNDANYHVYKKLENGKYQICPMYATWKSMLVRCYSTSKSNVKANPSYVGATVCQDWLRFSKFYEWMVSKTYYKMVLDKDILRVGSEKTYSPDTCAFITPITNSFITESGSMRGELPIGVTTREIKDKLLFVAACGNPFTKEKREYLGCYPDAMSAHESWRLKKMSHAITLSKMELDQRVKLALVQRYSSVKNGGYSYAV